VRRREPDASEGVAEALGAVPSVAAPGTGNRHIELFGHLIPGQAMVAESPDLLGKRDEPENRRDAW
jgi:hypothetical protein